MIARFRPTYSYSDIIFSAIARKTQLDRLRQLLQEMYGTKHVFLFNEGRVALYSLLKGLNVKGGVISPAYNCVVVPDAIRFSGMSNQFADISLDDYNMTPNSVLKVVNNKSKVLLATHQFGIPCDMEAMKSIAKKKNLILFEDSAASIGAKIGNKLVGTFGDATIVSFQDTKVISAVSGGALIIHDKNIARKIKQQHNKYNFNNNFVGLKKSLIFKVGTNPYFYPYVFSYWTKKSGAYTMAEESVKNIPEDYVNNMNYFSAALVNSQFLDLKININKRNIIAKKYLNELRSCKNIDLPKYISGVTPSWVRFPIRVKQKNKFFEKVIENGVDLAWTFSYSCSQVYNDLNKNINSVIAANEVLDLPIYPDLSEKEINCIISALS